MYVRIYHFLKRAHAFHGAVPMGPGEAYIRMKLPFETGLALVTGWNFAAQNRNVSNVYINNLKHN